MYLSDLRIAEGEEIQAEVEFIKDTREALSERFLALEALWNKVSDCEWSDMHDLLMNEKDEMGLVA